MSPIPKEGDPIYFSVLGKQTFSKEGEVITEVKSQEIKAVGIVKRGIEHGRLKVNLLATRSLVDGSWIKQKKSEIIEIPLDDVEL